MEASDTGGFHSLLSPDFRPIAREGEGVGEDAVVSRKWARETEGQAARVETALSNTEMITMSRRTYDRGLGLWPGYPVIRWQSFAGFLVSTEGRWI